MSNNAAINADIDAYYVKRPKHGIKLIYADDDIVVVSKPAWLLSVPGKGADKFDSVASRVQQLYSTAKSTHRLDWATSGVILLALSAAAHREIHRQFAERETEKLYMAIVDGIVKDDEQIIDAPMRCDWDNRPKQIIDYEQGKSAKTIVKVDKRFTELNCTRLILKPITGRSHQLRLHLQHIGHPILGDLLYGADINNDKKPTDRLLLHAQELVITHPITKQRMTFSDEAEF